MISCSRSKLGENAEGMYADHWWRVSHFCERMCGNEWRAPFLSKEVGRDELKLRVFFGAEELTLPSTLSTSDLAVGARELCDPHTLPTLFRSLAAVTNVGRSAHIAALQQTSPTIREAAQLRQELAHLCFALFHLPVQVVQLRVELVGRLRQGS
mmetsp:Transcript_34984/g.81916  ORF Transcript_34984/g.81916 Transcript_34984/m.81916 type:complete len:154 (-) Transcript_34984:97-558(-)